MSIQRFSLVVVWLATGVVSLIERDGQSLVLLNTTVLAEWQLDHAAIWSGAILDICIGIGLLLYPKRWMYDVALWAMLTMTLVATLLTPTLWLHPLGPLLKNLPIAAMLLQLRKEPS